MFDHLTPNKPKQEISEAHFKAVNSTKTLNGALLFHTRNFIGSFFVTPKNVPSQADDPHPAGLNTPIFKIVPENENKALRGKVGPKTSRLANQLIPLARTALGQNVKAPLNEEIGIAPPSNRVYELLQKAFLAYNGLDQIINIDPEKAILSVFSQAQDLLVGTNPQEIVESLNEVSDWFKAYRQATETLRGRHFDNKADEEKAWADALGDKWHTAFPANSDFVTRQKAIDDYLDQTVERLRLLLVPADLIRERSQNIGAEVLKSQFRPNAKAFLFNFVNSIQNRSQIYQTAYTFFDTLIPRLWAFRINLFSPPIRQNVFIVENDVVRSCSEVALKRGVRLGMTLEEARRIYLRKHLRERVEVVDASQNLQPQQILVDQIDGRQVVRACSAAASALHIHPGMDAETAVQIFNQNYKLEEGIEKVSAELIHKGDPNSAGLYYRYPGLEDLLSGLIINAIKTPEIILQNIINGVRTIRYVGRIFAFIILMNVYATWPLRKVTMASLRYMTGIRSTDALAREFARNTLRHINNPAIKVLAFRWIDRLLTTLEQGKQRAQSGKIEQRHGNIDNEPVLGNILIDFSKAIFPTLIPSVRTISRSRLIKTTVKANVWIAKKVIVITAKMLNYTLNANLSKRFIENVALSPATFRTIGRVNYWVLKKYFTRAIRLAQPAEAARLRTIYNDIVQQDNNLHTPEFDQNVRSEIKQYLRVMDTVIRATADNRSILHVTHKIFSHFYTVLGEQGFVDTHQEHYVRAGHSWAQFIHQTLLAVKRTQISFHFTNNDAEQNEPFEKSGRCWKRIHLEAGGFNIYFKFTQSVRDALAEFNQFKSTIAPFVAGYEKEQSRLIAAYNHIRYYARRNNRRMETKWRNTLNGIVARFNRFAAVFKNDTPFITALYGQRDTNNEIIGELRKNIQALHSGSTLGESFNNLVREPRSEDGMPFITLISQLGDISSLLENRILSLEKDLKDDFAEHGNVNPSYSDELSFIKQLHADKQQVLGTLEQILQRDNRADWVSTFNRLESVISRLQRWTETRAAADEARILEMEQENQKIQTRLQLFNQVVELKPAEGNFEDQIFHWQKLDILSTQKEAIDVWNERLMGLRTEAFSEYRYEEKQKLEKQHKDLENQLVAVKKEKENSLNELMNNPELFAEFVRRKTAMETHARFEAIPEGRVAAPVGKFKQLLNFVVDQVVNWEEKAGPNKEGEVEKCKVDLQKFLPEQFTSQNKKEALIRGAIANIEAKLVNMSGREANAAMYADPVWMLQRTGSEVYEELLNVVGRVATHASKNGVVVS